jgi:diacylglycerol O-acyltransferase-1
MVKKANTTENNSDADTDQQNYLEILLRQNAALELAVSQLTSELAEATAGILLRGYLFKWRDREISFAAKWSLRYFVLQGNTLSYFIDESDRRPRKTIDLSTCIVHDEGYSKTGNFHIFGLYLANSYELTKGPQGGAILRLSTKNEADANNWIEMLNKACKMRPTENNSNQNKMDNTDSIDNVNSKQKPILSRINSARNTLDEFEKTRLNSPRKGITNIDTNANNTSSKATKPKPFKPSSFPASKAIHKESHESPLSLTAKEQNYRGFFHLMVIIMSVTHFRQAYDSMLKYGLLLSLSAFSLRPSIESSSHHESFSVPKPVLAFISWCLIAVVSYYIEKLTYKKIISERFYLIIMFLWVSIICVMPCVFVWQSTENSGLCMIYLMQSMIIAMKLISYSHVNRDYRLLQYAMKEADIVSGTDTSNDSNAKPPLQDNIFLEIKDLETPILQYPQNLTLSNIAYFCVAPTLCYQLNYPRSKEIRWKYVATLVFRLAVVASFIIYLCEQHINPVLVSSLESIRNMDIRHVFRHLLAICIPNTYVWLAGFYFFFHLWLNLFAELTRFGDRRFYLDWWNARSIDEYWRKWNLPVHNWMIRHMYYPLIRAGWSRSIAVFIVFLYSAVVHEVIISIPFRSISFHAFLGMMAQAPLVELTKKFNAIVNNALLGNCFFWMTFCIVGTLNSICNF